MRLFDPIHGFIHLNRAEENVLHTLPVQRMRYIHQLAMAYMVYPGGCHKRFEHSVGVMELATRIYRQITSKSPALKGEIPETEKELKYWESVVRMAALCHDVGHLPFSHAAEEVILPAGRSHEEITVQFILSDYMTEAFASFDPPLKGEDVAYVAVGEGFSGIKGSHFAKILHKVIAGDVFGADRIDYLLRDSYHTGLKYGDFDYSQLITHLSLEKGEEGVALAVDADGVIAAESLLLARYFMFNRLYWHPSQIIQTIHLNEYLGAYWEEHYAGKFQDWGALTPLELKEILSFTDGEVISDMRRALLNPGHNRHELAGRVLGPKRFKLVYKPSPQERVEDPRRAKRVFNELKKTFGAQVVRFAKKKGKASMISFPVKAKGLQGGQSIGHSRLLENIPILEEEFVFIQKDFLDKANALISNGVLTA